MALSLKHLIKRSHNISSVVELSTLLKQPKVTLQELLACPERNYYSFEVPKKNGDSRTINAPSHTLKTVQHSFLHVLYESLKIPAFMFGGVPRKSIFGHAKKHVGREMVATLDVRNFYPSMKRNRVEELLFEVGLRDQALQSSLEFVLRNNELPQGAPTSCILANFGFVGVDSKFVALCKKQKLKYSRFVDDIAISGDSLTRDQKGAFISFIKEGGFEVATEKVHFFDRSQRQEVTGLIVNEKLRPTKKFITRVNKIIANCLNYGVEYASWIEGKSPGKLRQSLRGRIEHIKQADPIKGEKIRKKMYGIDWSP